MFLVFFTMRLLYYEEYLCGYLVPWQSIDFMVLGTTSFFEGSETHKKLASLAFTKSIF